MLLYSVESQHRTSSFISTIHAAEQHHHCSAALFSPSPSSSTAPPTMSLAVISSTNQQTSSSSTNRNSTHQTQLKPPPFVARLSFIVEAVFLFFSVIEVVLSFHFWFFVHRCRRLTILYLRCPLKGKGERGRICGIAPLQYPNPGSLSNRNLSSWCSPVNDALNRTKVGGDFESTTRLCDLYASSELGPRRSKMPRLSSAEVAATVLDNASMGSPPKTQSNTVPQRQPLFWHAGRGGWGCIPAPNMENPAHCRYETD
ncbi:hypothetical protein Ahy_B02g058115 isoform B [Arachis hypogaea]|uniref:Uncharacterized protein n=1 Tax=Arachis hypogaea TaxID=3818 RepID=A0A445ADV3_ARAHY|nr:hypothetical protein Ahy_B02g058115 isoform B [Arachis hypogaea]